MRLLFDDLDTDGSGDLDFAEFLSLMVRHREANQLSLLEEDRNSFRHLERLNAPKPGPFGLRVSPWAFAMWELVVLVGTLWYESTRLGRGERGYAGSWGFAIDAAAALPADV
eukprot:gene45228-31212_t